MLLEVKGVSKYYKSKKNKTVLANDNVSMNIEKGQIYGLLGHNGAGKTTLVNQILGILSSTSGEILLKGKPVSKNPVFARRTCSIQPQSQIPLGFLTPSQAVSIMGGLRGGKKEEVQNKMKKMFEALDISEWANKEAVNLSGGILRLTSFCMATVVPGDLVILDEPTNDIDPVRRRYLWNEIRNLTDTGTSVILVTHNVLEAERAVDKVAIMNEGKIIVQGVLSEIRNQVENKMRFNIATTVEAKQIKIPDWCENIHVNGTQITFATDVDKISPLVNWLTKEIDEKNVLEYSIEPTNLEDVYIKLTGKKEEK